MRFLLLVITCLLFANCATLNPDQQAYINIINSFPLEFSVLVENDKDAWGRAQSFIGQYSNMKIQVATDYVIQTYNPIDQKVKYGYSVTKTPDGDNIVYKVQCFCGNLLFFRSANKNSHILSYYIKTGNLHYPEMISK